MILAILFFIILSTAYLIKLKTIDRYILKSLLKAFLVGVLLVMVVMISQLLFEVSDLIIVENIKFNVVLRYTFYQLPNIISETFPIAVLFAVMTVINDLSSKREITAMQMGGISLVGILIPVLFFGLVVTTATIGVNETIVPQANLRSRQLIRKHLQDSNNLETEEDMVFRDEDSIYYIQEIDQDGTLREIIIYRLKEGSYPDMITARSGSVEQNQWKLRDASFFNYNESGALEFQSRGEEMNFKIERDPRTFYENWRSPQEMSRQELKGTINTFRESGLQANRLITDYHLKLSGPFFGIVFALIGFSLSLKIDKQSLNKVIIVFIVFLYYIALSVFRSLGRNSVIEPLFAAWIPILLFSGVGLLLLTWQQNLKRKLKLNFNLLQKQL